MQAALPRRRDGERTACAFVRKEKSRGNAAKGRNPFTNVAEGDIIVLMKKVIEIEDLCCRKCAERVERKLLLLDGVTGAKANFKKGWVFVETVLPDEALASCVTDAGFHVQTVRPRRGLFG